jgi:hypothetical protein
MTAEELANKMIPPIKERFLFNSSILLRTTNLHIGAIEIRNTFDLHSSQEGFKYWADVLTILYREDKLQ